MKKNAITLNPINETIGVTKAFYQKACIYGTDEYYLLKQARAEEPEYTIVFKSSKKNSYNNLDYKSMEAHINHTFKDDKEALKAAIAEYAEMKEYAKARKSAYPIMKKWFLEKYKDEYNEIIKSDNEKEKDTTENDTIKFPVSSPEEQKHA